MPAKYATRNATIKEAPADVETVEVRVPARAWEGAEMWTSIPAVSAAVEYRGSGKVYVLQLTRASCSLLFAICTLGFEPNYEADASERRAYRTTCQRILDALGLKLKAANVAEMEGVTQDRIIMGAVGR